ncbi:MAG TPA: universal stress protein, partial [Flavobacteriales bacterium]|nr:universal stress protein [Flavobacteriales bacterium]
TLVALDQAINLAKVINGEITIVNVIEDYGFFNKYISSTERDDMVKRTTEKMSKLAAEKSQESGIHINSMLSHGKIYEKINEVAEMIGATLIMMGTSGSMGLMKFIGSNTLRVVRESKIPVISVKGTDIKPGLDNILLPLDLSKETKEKVAKAIWLSKLYGGVKVSVVSVAYTSDKTLLAKMKKQEAQVINFLQGKGIIATSEFIRDSGGKKLADLILDYAKKVDAGLIMIMTQQENDITDMFIGSAAQAIINNSEIPVMSVVPVPKKLTAVL